MVRRFGNVNCLRHGGHFRPLGFGKSGLEEMQPLRRSIRSEPQRSNPLLCNVGSGPVRVLRAKRLLDALQLAVG